MDDSERLDPGLEHHIAQSVADGTATPEEARRLLVEFVRQVEAYDVSRRMLEHFAECVRAYLDGKKRLLPAPEVDRYDEKDLEVPVPTLEKAFGLKRVTSGKPRVADDMLSIVAREVLERLLRGETLDTASEAVAHDRWVRSEQVSSGSQVREAWASHRVQGLVFMRAARALESQGLSRAELERLDEIFDGVPDIVPPGMSIADFWRKQFPDEPLPQPVAPKYPANKSA